MVIITICIINITIMITMSMHCGTLFVVYYITAFTIVCKITIQHTISYKQNQLGSIGKQVCFKELFKTSTNGADSICEGSPFQFPLLSCCNSILPYYNSPQKSKPKWVCIGAKMCTQMSIRIKTCITVKQQSCTCQQSD